MGRDRQHLGLIVFILSISMTRVSQVIPDRGNPNNLIFMFILRSAPTYNNNPSDPLLGTHLSSLGARQQYLLSLAYKDQISRLSKMIPHKNRYRFASSNLAASESSSIFNSNLFDRKGYKVTGDRVKYSTIVTPPNSDYVIDADFDQHFEELFPKQVSRPSHFNFLGQDDCMMSDWRKRCRGAYKSFNSTKYAFFKKNREYIVKWKDLFQKAGIDVENNPDFFLEVFQVYKDARAHYYSTGEYFKNLNSDDMNKLGKLAIYSFFGTFTGYNQHSYKFFTHQIILFVKKVIDTHFIFESTPSSALQIFHIDEEQFIALLLAFKLIDRESLLDSNRTLEELSKIPSFPKPASSIFIRIEQNTDNIQESSVSMQYNGVPVKNPCKNSDDRDGACSLLQFNRFMDKYHLGVSFINLCSYGSDYPMDLGKISKALIIFFLALIIMILASTARLMYVQNNATKGIVGVMLRETEHEYRRAATPVNNPMDFDDEPRFRTSDLEFVRDKSLTNFGSIGDCD